MIVCVCIDSMCVCVCVCMCAPREVDMCVRSVVWAETSGRIEHLLTSLNSDPEPGNAAYALDGLALLLHLVALCTTPTRYTHTHTHTFCFVFLFCCLFFSFFVKRKTLKYISKLFIF